MEWAAAKNQQERAAVWRIPADADADAVAVADTKSGTRHVLAAKKKKVNERG